jgi:hypothetical protein
MTFSVHDGKLENVEKQDENLSKFQGTMLQPDGCGRRRVYLYYL